MMRLFAYGLAIAGTACGSVSTSVDKSNEPTVSMVMPDHGGVAGGAMITVMGSHFSGGTPTVLVGSHVASTVTVVSDTQLTFMSPPGDDDEAGATVDVTVANEHGFGTKDAAFTFNLPIAVLSISPSSGKSIGGTTVTITGRGFTADAGTPTVMLAGAPATNVQIVSDTMLTATSGPAPAGTLAFTPEDVIVSNQNGTFTLPKAYSVSKPGLLALGPTSRCCGLDAVMYVDPTNGAVARLSTTTIHVHSCALDVSGVMYVVGSPTGVTNGQRALYTLDPLTGNATIAGPLNDGVPANHNIASISFDGNTLYGIDAGGGVGTPSNKLVTINPQSGAVTLVGNAMTVARNNAIAAKDAANVYVIDNFAGSLDTVAVATGARTAGLALAGGPTGDNPHGMVNTGTAMYVSSTYNRVIFTVNVTSSASLTSLTTVSNLGALTGLCQTPPSF